MNPAVHQERPRKRFFRLVGGAWLWGGGVFLIAALTAAPVLGESGSKPDEAPLPKGFKLYETRYYKMQTDLDQDTVREAILRMDAMAEEYHRRTAGFAGTIQRKLPFYLFKNEADFRAAGGPDGACGVFMFATLGGKLDPSSGRLLAIAGEKVSDDTWHTVQHEGFHQFVAYVVKGEIPIWVDEGLAEYFGEAVFTGDGFVSGTLPSERVRLVKEELAAMKDLKTLIQMKDEDWDKDVSPSSPNYDQVWSLVYFLAHADKGKYSQPLCGFLNNCAAGTPSDKAWTQNFGPDIEARQKEWKKFWTDLPEDAGAETQARITVATLTSFLARAALQKQTFATSGAFFEAAKAGQLKCDKDSWLPPSLLVRSLGEAGKLSTWAIEPSTGGRPSLVLKTTGGKTYIGKYSNAENKVTKVVVEVQQRAATAKPVAAAAASSAERAATATSAAPAGKL